jgi:ABC-type bacteriocin/lantibiotic exporter with double-glycine peptidase domain
MILRIFNQEHDFSCGVACVAMLASLNKGSVHDQYSSCIKFLFPKLTENQLEKTNVDLRTKIGQLQSYLSEQGLRTTRFKLNDHSVEQFEAGVSIVLIHAQKFLHWVLVFKVSNDIYVVDPEEETKYKFSDYFSYDGYDICLNKMHIKLPDLYISNVVLSGAQPIPIRSVGQAQATLYK